MNNNGNMNKSEQPIRQKRNKITLKDENKDDKK